MSATVTKGVAGGGASTETYGYRYDSAGRRIRKSGPAGDTRYLWGAGELVEEIAPGGSKVLYERMGSLVTGVTAIAADGSSLPSERVLHDGLGSVVGRARTDGTWVLYRYDAWGSFRGAEAPATGEATLAYAGQHWDADVGLSYAQQRWYEPRMGRFLSEDPLGATDERLREPARLQTFAYAAINPLRWTDPLGLDVGQPESTSARAQEDMAYEAARNEWSRDEGNWLTGCIAGEADNWQHIDGAAFNARSKSPGWLAGYLKCHGRPVADAWHDSDIGKTTREFWTATPARAQVMGCVLGGGNGALPVGDVNNLPESMQGTAAMCQFGVADRWARRCSSVLPRRSSRQASWG